MNKALIGKITFVVIMVFVGLTVAGTAFTVKTGEVAIISRFGKVLKTKEPGLHFKVPFTDTAVKVETRDKVYYYNKSREFGDKSLMVSTKDMQTINLEIAVQANIHDPQKLYETFQGRYETRLIDQRVKEITQSNISKYTIEEFISKRMQLSKSIFEDLKSDLLPYGITVTNVSLTDHDFSPEYEKAIEQKKIAEQEVEKMRFEQERFQVEAESKVTLAEYKLREKELQAQANKIESISLTPELLKKQMIEKWDGRLPQVQGAGANTLINLESE